MSVWAESENGAEIKKISYNFFPPKKKKIMKKEYMKPALNVVTLQQQCHILAGSHLVKSFPASSEDITWEDGLEDSDDLR